MASMESRPPVGIHNRERGVVLPLLLKRDAAGGQIEPGMDERIEIVKIFLLRRIVGCKRADD